MAKFGEVLIVSDSDEDDELQIVSEHIVPAKTSLELTPVEERRIRDQLDLDPNVAVQIRVTSTGGGGISRGLLGMARGKLMARCKVVSEGMLIKQKNLDSQKIFEPVKNPTMDAALSTKFSKIMTISSDDSEEELESDIFRKVKLRKMKKPSRVTDHLIKQHSKRAEHQQQAALGDNIPNLHNESPTVKDLSNQEICPINKSNQAKSRNQVHSDEHSAVHAVQVESQVTADNLESQVRVNSEIAASIQVQSVDQVQIEELLLSENLDISKVAITVSSEANIIPQESSTLEESVIPGIGSGSTTKSSYPESSSLREEFSIELPAEPAPIEFPEYNLKCPDESDKLASPVSCEHESASDNLNDEVPSSRDITDEAPSSENITDNALAYEYISDEASSSEEIVENALSSEDFTDEAPSSEGITDEATSSENIDQAPSSENIIYENAASTQNEDLPADQFDEAEDNLPLPETQIIHAESSCTAQVPHIPSSHNSSLGPKQVSSHPPSLSSLGIKAVRPGQLFLPTNQLSQLYPPGTIVDVVSVSTNLGEELVWDGWAVSHVSLATAVRVLDKYGDVFGMRKELMVKQQLGDLGKKTHQMDDQSRLGVPSPEVSGRKEDFLAMMGLCMVEEVDSRVAEIDQRREIARSTTRLRSGNRRKQSPGEGMMGGKRPRAVRSNDKKRGVKGKGKKRK